MKQYIPWLFILLFLVLPVYADAYLDPGSGSYFLQILIAALFSMLFVGQQWWSGIKGFLKGIFRKGEPPTDNREGSE